MEKIKTYISVLEGVVSYHERKTNMCEYAYKIDLHNPEASELHKVSCPINSICDLYCGAVEVVLEIMKNEDGEVNRSIEELRDSAIVIRCLIGYHKIRRYKCIDCSCQRVEVGVVDRCKDPEDGHTKCPKTEGDIYLEALEEGLRLIEKRIIGQKPL